MKEFKSLLSVQPSPEQECLATYIQSEQMSHRPTVRCEIMIEASDGFANTPFGSNVLMFEYVLLYLSPFSFFTLINL